MSTIDQGDLILGLLSDAKATADADRRAIETRLSDLGAGVAALRSTSEAQTTQLAEMRAESRADLHQISVRLAEVERQSQAIPQVAERVSDLENRVGSLSEIGNRRHAEIDRRVRDLENTGIADGVYRRGAAVVFSSLVRWAVPMAAAAALGWAGKSVIGG